MMGCSLEFVWLIMFFIVSGDHGVVGSNSNSKEEESFDKHYEVIWGNHHNYVLPINQGKQLQLSLDNCSGSGFGSKMSYGSGFFHLWIKVPGGDSSGVVTAFYLSSRGERHDEIDMEFLGNKEGKPYTLQTNVYVDGEGGREQRLRLWFDPSAYFHNYRILWNSRHIVFFVDNIPIRIFKNKSDVGGRYPSQAMRIEATIWNGDDWATDGGRSKINLKYAPFKAYFQGFDIRACELVEAQRSSSSSNARNCSSDRFAWNKKIFWKLDPGRQRVYNAVRKKYMTYDYCADRPRFPTPPKECI